MQNFHDGIFNYHQINFVVDALEKMGENVLVRAYSFEVVALFAL
jgi:hypothetical protein